MRTPPSPAAPHDAGDDDDDTEREIEQHEPTDALGQPARGGPVRAAHGGLEARIVANEQDCVDDHHDAAQTDHRVHAPRRAPHAAVLQQQPATGNRDHDDRQAHGRQEAREHARKHGEPIRRRQRRQALAKHQQREAHAANPHDDCQHVQRDDP